MWVQANSWLLLLFIIYAMAQANDIKLNEKERKY